MTRVEVPLKSVSTWVYARETEDKEFRSKPIVQYTEDPRLHAVFEQFGESGRSFNYSESICITSESIPEQQIMAYLVKIQRGGFIQPFGSMIAINEPSSCILDYSDNAHDMLDITLQSVPSLDDKNDVAFALGTDVRALFTHCSALLLEKAFSVFVANPNKPREVKIILSKNQEKLLDLLHNLSPRKENCIGKGGYAEVYKGCLPNGQLVAIKTLTRGTKNETIGDFLSELGIMAHVNHSNTAKLVGYGVEGVMYLVLELSEKGCLASMLNGSKDKLPWSIRQKIALGTAKGIIFTWAATLKARVLKEVWNIAAVFPVEKNLAGGGGGNDNGSNGSSNSSFSGEIVLEENFLGICSRELLARGCELLKRTRTGILPEIYIFVLFFLVCLNQIFEPFDGFTEGKGALFKLSFLHMNIFFLKFSHYCPTCYLFKKAGHFDDLN
ncbi:hypothetical protein JHK87_044542 [Glycine soja]|nr:hypothetical protein JHK87_044542 [Glycine soja]